MPLEYEEQSPEVAARRRSEDRKRELLALTAAFYHRVLRESPQAEGARTYLTERGVSWEMAERFQLGFSADEHAGHRRRAQAAVRRPRARGDRHHAARPLGAGRPHDGPPRVHALRRARAADRVRGPAPAARRVRREVRQLAREPALAQGLDAVRPAPRAHRDREGGGGDRRRGLHRRDRPRPGGLRQRRGLDGNGADRSRSCASCASSRATSCCSSTPTRPAARPRCAASSSPRATDLRVRVALPPRGSDPGRGRGGGPRGGRSHARRRPQRARVPRRARARRGRRRAAPTGATRPTRRCARSSATRRRRPSATSWCAWPARACCLDPVDGVAAASRARRAGARPPPEPPARVRLPMDAAQRDERLLLALALASGERGLATLERVPPEALTHEELREAHAWVRARLNQDDAPVRRTGTAPRGGARGAGGTARGAGGARRRWRAASSRVGSNADWNPSRRSSPQPR